MGDMEAGLLGMNSNMLADYRVRVAARAQSRNGEPIGNSSYDHAAIIIEQMFHSANRQVSVLSGSLNARVYGRDELVDQAEFFLAQGDRSARFLVESDDPSLVKNHPLLERLRNNGNVELRVVPKDIQKLYNYHFLVMDDDSYRFEPARGTPTAVAAFGDKETAGNFSQVFDAIWEASREINLPPLCGPESVAT